MQASTIVLVCHWHERKFIGLFEALWQKMQCIFCVLGVRLRGKKMGSVTFLRLKRPTGGAFEAMFSVVLELVLLRGKKAFQATPTQLLRVPFKIFDEYHPYFLYGSIRLLLKYFCLTTAKLKTYLHKWFPVAKARGCNFENITITVFRLQKQTQS